MDLEGVSGCIFAIQGQIQIQIHSPASLCLCLCPVASSPYTGVHREGYQRTFVKASAGLYFCNSGTNRDSGPQPSSLSLHLCLWRPYRILESI